MTVGFLAKQNVQKLLDQGDIAAGDSRMFFDAAKAFYTSTVHYFKSHMPLIDPLLKAYMFLDFEQRELANVADVEYFIDRFEILFGRDDPILLNKIHEEFLDYQWLNREDIPKSVWQKAEHNIATKDTDFHCFEKFLDYFLLYHTLMLVRREYLA